MKTRFIQFFAEAGAAAAPAGTAGVSAGGAAPDAGVQQGSAEGAPSPPQAESREARRSLRELIDGDEGYKSEYRSMMSDIVRRRLGDTKPLEAKAKLLDEMAPALARRYGLDAADLEGISRAVQGGDPFPSAAAAEKDAQTISGENRRMKNRLDAVNAQRVRRDTIARWKAQIPGIKRLYPSFDLNAEMQDPRFARLCHTMDLRCAYETLHRDTINAAMMQYAGRRAAEQIAQNVAANQARPAEGGLSTDAAPALEFRPRDFTNDQRKTIKDRVRRGEKVRF